MYNLSLCTLIWQTHQQKYGVNTFNRPFNFFILLSICPMHFEVQRHPHITYACIISGQPPSPLPERSASKYDIKIAALVNISYPGPTLTHQLWHWSIKFFIRLYLLKLFTDLFSRVWSVMCQTLLLLSPNSKQVCNWSTDPESEKVAALLQNHNVLNIQ